MFWGNLEMTEAWFIRQNHCDQRINTQQYTNPLLIRYGQTWQAAEHSVFSEGGKKGERIKTTSETKCPELKIND